MNLPNAITVVRLILVLPIAYLLSTGKIGWALLLMILAGISDMLDGVLARLLNQRTRWGSIADPIADKLLVLAVVSALLWTHEIPWWFFVAVVGRDLIIAVTVIVMHRQRRLPEKIQPLFSSKLTVVVQLSLIIATVLNIYFERPWTITIYYAVGAAITIASLLHYVLVWRYLVRPPPSASYL